MMVQLVLVLIVVYLACGLVFVIPFFMKGIKKIDEGAHGSSFGFRLIITPGIILLWPVLIKKWLSTGKE